MKNATNGFLLVEALLAILILSITLVAAMGAIGQALQVNKRCEESTKLYQQLESFLFTLEAGTRMDLVKYGGSTKMEDKTELRVTSTPLSGSAETTSFGAYHLTSSAEKPRGPALKFELFVTESTLS